MNLKEFFKILVNFQPIIIVSIFFNTQVFSQSGTAEDPFTSLVDAWGVPTDGIYHFSIGDASFSTFVEAGNGWILIASGQGDTYERHYTVTTELTLQSDQILHSYFYTRDEITAVRMTATGGTMTPFDVESNSINVLNNLRIDRTLSANTDQEDWTGIGTEKLRPSTGCQSLNASLAFYIYHACGNQTGLVWAVGYNSYFEWLDYTERVKYDLNLWMKAQSSELDIEVLNFKCQSLENNWVDIRAKLNMTSKISSATIERSFDGVNWSTVHNFTPPIEEDQLQFVDKSQLLQLCYYRLKLLLSSGKIHYSSVKKVDQSLASKRIYPNPFTSEIHIVGQKMNHQSLRIINQLGTDLTKLCSVKKMEDGLFINTVNLPVGVYFISFGAKSYTVIKK